MSVHLNCASATWEPHQNEKQKMPWNQKKPCPWRVIIPTLNAIHGSERVFASRPYKNPMGIEQHPNKLTVTHFQAPLKLWDKYIASLFLAPVSASSNKP